MEIIESTPGNVEARRSWLPWGVAAVLLAAVAAVSLLQFRETRPEPPVTITSINPPENTGLYAVYNAPALSPDGRRIVFSASGTNGRPQLWVRPLNSPSAQPLAGTQEAKFPFWSPDSRSIAFFADGKLKRMDAAGGHAFTVADAPLPLGGSWSPRGAIVFAPQVGPLQRVPAAGGAPISATTFDRQKEYTHYAPWFLPDGNHFLFADQSRVTASGGLTLRIGALDSSEVKTVGSANSDAVYSSGYLLYMRENTLMAQPFSEKRLATTGDALPLAERVMRSGGGDISIGVFSVATDGLLAYQTRTTDSLRQLTWFNRRGQRVGTLGDPGSIYSVEFSPDRKSVAATRRSPNDDIWIYAVARALPTRLTFGPAEHRAPVWSPDARYIAYQSNAKGQFDLYRKVADGTGSEELLYADGRLKVPTSWSADGSVLLYTTVWDPLMNAWVLPIGPKGAAGAPSKLFPRLAAPSSVSLAKFSPGGRWVCYVSDESGQEEVYVAAFPGAGSKRQVSTGGGLMPRWRADGKEVFYVAPSGTLMAAEISVQGTTIEAGPAYSLGIPAPYGTFYPYDVSADGQRFLVAVPREQKSAEAFTLVQNWTAQLKKK